MKASSASPKAARRTRATAAAQRPTGEPLTNLNFEVFIEQTNRRGAVEVVLPSARIVELPRKRREVEFGPLVIRRGLTASSEWYDWWNDARRLSRPQRRLVIVDVRRSNGGEGARWAFRDSVPIAYSVSPLNALIGAPLLETLELKVGGFEQIQHE